MSVLTHPIEAPYVTGQATYGSVRPIWWGNWLLHSAAGRHSQARPARVTDTLREGDEVAGLSVRHVPGHAPGMIALVHPVDRAIIAGDTFVSRDGRLAPPARIFTADLAEARRSMRKLAGEDFEHMLASHGQPILGSGKIEAERAAG